jgi:hypothetical protein
VYSALEPPKGVRTKATPTPPLPTMCMNCSRAPEGGEDQGYYFVPMTYHCYHNVCVFAFDGNSSIPVVDRGPLGRIRTPHVLGEQSPPGLALEGFPPKAGCRARARSLDPMQSMDK